MSSGSVIAESCHGIVVKIATSTAPKVAGLGHERAAIPYHPGCGNQTLLRNLLQYVLPFVRPRQLGRERNGRICKPSICKPSICNTRIRETGIFSSG
jgi:hypothetical protein